MADRTLVFILGDQLSPRISSLAGASKADTIVLMAEVAAETNYVRHHKKKIAFLFSAMRHFAEELAADGWHVDYVRLDVTENSGSFTGELERALKRHDVASVRVTEPGEWRVLKELESWSDTFAIPVEIRADTRFLCSHAEFAAWAKGRKQLRMEYFYREMRKRTGLLMTEGGEPVGDRWNYDADNRKPADEQLRASAPPHFAPDGITREVLQLVADRFAGNFGDLEPFRFAVTAADAERALDHFIARALPRFGDHQDVMLAGEPFLNHSVLSPYINAGLLDPLEVARAAVAAFERGEAPLNAVEGFVRQIIGWREYVRGVYWLKMPDYAESNYLHADRDLPWFYWSGETDMRCVAEVVGQTRREAYAHHIQRLMITGNLAMLLGVDPRQIHEWYLVVYADAYEWVELPNVIGMSQFADGGLLGSKPYAAGGSYINRMSNYCKSCRFDVSKKTGPGSCPFNALYWDFLDRNRERLGTVQRLATVYSSWDRMGEERQRAYRESASAFLATLDSHPGNRSLTPPGC